MARTKGSGWGGGKLFYQICPVCNRKKALYVYIPTACHYKCTYCKEIIHSDELLPFLFYKQYENYQTELKIIERLNIN